MEKKMTCGECPVAIESINPALVACPFKDRLKQLRDKTRTCDETAAVTEDADNV